MLEHVCELKLHYFSCSYSWISHHQNFKKTGQSSFLESETSKNWTVPPKTGQLAGMLHVSSLRSVNMIPSPPNSFLFTGYPSDNALLSRFLFWFINLSISKPPTTFPPCFMQKLFKDGFAQHHHLHFSQNSEHTLRLLTNLSLVMHRTYGINFQNSWRPQFQLRVSRNF